ncbi:beta-galactosidase 17 [Tanacetum coccineum]|uniref:Beta-galactosidase 17 n=1 Tax=Tanacetum coccineum TaxID=301880 RepID=A0ABQ5FVT8_9ASTR
MSSLMIFINQYNIYHISVPEFIGEGYSISTICVEYEWASPGCSSFGHVLDECPKKIDSDVLPNLKKPIQAIRGIPVGSKLKSTFIYRPVQSTKITDKAPAKPKVTKVTNSTTSISNSCDALNTLVDEDDYGGMNSASTQEPEQVEGSGKKDINTSVPTRLCYKTPISVVSSVHKSSLVASDSHNSTPLAERINKLGKQMLDGKLILVDDDVKSLNKVDSDPVDSDSEREVEVAYDERLNSWLVEVLVNRSKFTNFGFYNGANAVHESDYPTDLTSYDYDAPISESGDVDGAKFKDRDLSTKAIESENSISMEVVGQMFRFLLYASEYTFKVNGNTLSIPKGHPLAIKVLGCFLVGKAVCEWESELRRLERYPIDDIQVLISRFSLNKKRKDS